VQHTNPERTGQARGCHGWRQGEARATRQPKRGSSSKTIENARWRLPWVWGRVESAHSPPNTQLPTHRHVATRGGATGLGVRSECSQPSEHATPDPPACCHHNHPTTNTPPQRFRRASRELSPRRSHPQPPHRQRPRRHTRHHGKQKHTRQDTIAHITLPHGKRLNAQSVKSNYTGLIPGVVCSC
jgi:hypothetical protein